MEILVIENSDYYWEVRVLKKGDAVSETIFWKDGNDCRFLLDGFCAALRMLDVPFKVEWGKNYTED